MSFRKISRESRLGMGIHSERNNPTDYRHLRHLRALLPASRRSRLLISSFDHASLIPLPPDLSRWRGRGTKSRWCARGRSEGQMAAADFAVSVYSDKRPRTGEEHERKKTAEERDKKDERAGAWAPQGLLLAIYGPAWPDTEDRDRVLAG